MAAHGVVIGVGLALIVSYQVLVNSSTVGESQLDFVVPWKVLAMLLAATLGASLLAILAPAGLGVANQACGGAAHRRLSGVTPRAPPRRRWRSMTTPDPGQSPGTCSKTPASKSSPRRHEGVRRVPYPRPLFPWFRFVQRRVGGAPVAREDHLAT